MSVAIITGSGGLVGSESVRHLVEAGFDVVGVDNDLRAAQPSHDWAASEPLTDFTINANGTLNLLDAARRHKPEATFVFTSANKVYGGRPNSLPLEDGPTRLELPEEHRYHSGIDTTMSIDASLHSVFGASKVAADVLVQEYGRYFEMPTVCFRGGCVTGPNHAGARLHGFLSYLMRCTVTGEHYTVYGYEGKQVRDNIHSADLARAFAAGSLGEAPRIGDHRWWISDLAPFRTDYPDWALAYGVEEILREIHDQDVQTWAVAV
jgi:CDP-paratose 2-epimerase